MLRLALTPRWLGFLALVLVLVTAFVGLSAWQVSRAQHKNDVTAAQDVDTVRPFTEVLDAQVPMPGYLSDQMVEMTGHYLPDMQVVVTERYQDGTEGFWVVTMFAPDGARLGEEAADVANDPAYADTPIAVPVVRGWTADEDLAMHSRAATGEVTLVGRLGPNEAPQNTHGLPDGQVRTVSAPQLVNDFDVFTYSGYVFPETESGAGASAATGGLVNVGLEKQESGGIDLQSAAYAAEWLFFAGFAIYIWWRLLRDAYLRQRDEEDGPQEFVVVKPAGQKNLAQNLSTSNTPDERRQAPRQEGRP